MSTKSICDTPVYDAAQLSRGRLPCRSALHSVANTHTHAAMCAVYSTTATSNNTPLLRGAS